MAKERVNLPRYERVAQFRAESFNPDDNTIEIVWTTGASVRRTDYWDGTEYDEVLSLEPGAVRLERLNLGAPYLDTHTSYSCRNVIGAVVPGTAEIKDGIGVCRILLSRAAGDADTVQKIKDGVIRNNSVGYWIHKVVKTEADDSTVARWEIVDWEPLEISAVPIPADPGSQIRSETTTQDGTGPQTRSCTFITSPPAAGPKPPAPAKQENRMSAATKKAPAKKTPAQRLAELETENKRLADLLAAQRAEEGKKDDEEERESEDEDEKRDDDMDEERDADDKKDGDDDSDDDRAADDDDGDMDGEDDKKKDDKRRAPATSAKRLTAADVRKAAEAAVRADRVRGSEIRKIAAQFGLPKLGERHVAEETSVRAFKDLVLERLAERQNKRGNTTFAAAGTPELDEEHGSRRREAPSASRDYDSAAADARALLGLKKAA